MRLLLKLRHPFVLVGQGFFLGGLLFFTSQPMAEPETQAPAQDSILATIAPVR